MFDIPSGKIKYMQKESNIQKSQILLLCNHLVNTLTYQYSQQLNIDNITVLMY